MSEIGNIYKQIDTNRGILYAWFDMMNTRVDIMLCNKDESTLKDVAATIHDRLYQLEKIANYFDSSSELSCVNKAAFRTPIIVSDDLFKIIDQCVSYNALTLGYFDVTICSENHAVDTVKTINLLPDNLAISFDKESTKINLSGYLKGYALEAIRDILSDSGIDDALVNVGNSSVLALGNHPHGKGWKVGFDYPTSSIKDIELYDECLTTSGNNTIERKHIISPFTHEYIEGVKAISVKTKKATDGEALSTALFAASPSQRKEILGNFEATVIDL